jgi:hypothetical protein
MMIHILILLKAVRRAKTLVWSVPL